MLIAEADARFQEKLEATTCSRWRGTGWGRRASDYSVWAFPGSSLFDNFLVAHGGRDIVKTTGELNIDDPTARKAACHGTGTADDAGYVPPGAINWLVVDNNAALFGRRIVMTPNATISISVEQADHWPCSPNRYGVRRCPISRRRT